MVLNAQMSIFLDTRKQLWYNYIVKKTITIRCWHKHLRRSVLSKMLPNWVLKASPRTNKQKLKKGGLIMIIKRTNPKKSWNTEQKQIALKILMNKILKLK